MADWPEEMEKNQVSNGQSLKQTAVQVFVIIKILSAVCRRPAEVAELADAHDSKSCSFGSVGSIPTFGTIRNDSTLLGM